CDPGEADDSPRGACVPGLGDVERVRLAPGRLERNRGSRGSRGADAFQKLAITRIEAKRNREPRLRAREREPLAEPRPLVEEFREWELGDFEPQEREQAAGGKKGSGA